MSDTAPTMREVIARTDAELSKDSGGGESGKTEKSERVPRETKPVKEAADPAPDAAPNLSDDDPLVDWAEAPPWIKRWGKDSQKAFKAWATDPNNGEAWKHVGNELTKHYTDWGKQAN